MMLRIAVVLFLSVFTSVLAIDKSELARLQADSQAAIKSFKRTDPGLGEKFKKATGYAVFPSVGKGGFIFAGARGKGLVFKKGQAIGCATMTQVTFGAQVGGQEYMQVIFFETKEALEDFQQSGFTMSAQVGAVAAAEGASEHARYVDGVMVFTKPIAGLMAEASVGGQKFDFEPLPKPASSR